MKFIFIILTICIISYIIVLLSSKKDESKNKKYTCPLESRGVSACTMEHNPVCGWNNNNIKCIKYPCASTYSNPCVACTNKDVEYYTFGECPIN